MLFAPDGTLVERGGARLGRRTNNEAEYEAVLYGLAACQRRNVSHLILRADSELLIKQVQGAYRVRNARLAPLYERVMAHIGQLEAFRAEHVRREYNREADLEANRALDARPSSATETI